MMGIGEAFAILGRQTWISTFCPFFDWKVMRRIAVGHQERLEAIEAPDGWLSDGHGLDLTMLATAANFETRTNGATHMGNDDSTIFDGMAHLKIVDVSCPQQMLSLMKWIMEGNRGLLYVRVMRTPSPVLYGPTTCSSSARASRCWRAPTDRAVIVSSGRGVHEALAAAAQCAGAGLPVGVVDMPSIDEDLLLALCRVRTSCWSSPNRTTATSSRTCSRSSTAAARRSRAARRGSWRSTRSIPDGRPRFIHSGTYEELTEAFGLSAPSIAESIRHPPGVTA